MTSKKRVYRVEYTVKNTGRTADEIRKFIKDKMSIECFVAVHPNRVKVTFSSAVPESALEILDEYISEQMEGKRIVTL